MGNTPETMGCNPGQAAFNKNPAAFSPGDAKIARKKLVNRMINPQEVILSATLATGGGITSIYFTDACALGTTLGLVGAANSQILVPATITAASLRAYLQTYALVVKGYDFYCTTQSEMSKNLKFPEASIDQDYDARTNFSAEYRTNLQNNANLLNISRGFVWDNTTSLLMNTVANATGANVEYTFTFFIESAVPYAELDSYLTAREATA